jgi:hypothetical protein
MMGTRAMLVSFGALALLAAAKPILGGWAVTTVHEVPTQFTVGQETTLTFSVRQHGVNLVSGLTPVLIVKRADAGMLTRSTRIEARNTRHAGIYTVAYTPTAPGDVVLTVDNGWPQRLEMRPIPVVAAGAAPVRVASVERGRALFVAAGCNMCHVKADDATLLDPEDVIAIGPAFTGRTWPVETIVKKVMDPASMPLASGAARMPRLEVSAENAALIAEYLNARQVATHR